MTMPRIKMPVSYYVSDFGVVMIDPNRSKDELILAGGEHSRLPDWFNRYFRPKFYRRLVQFREAEIRLKAKIRSAWEATGDAGNWVSQ